MWTLTAASWCKATGLDTTPRRVLLAAAQPAGSLCSLVYRLHRPTTPSSRHGRNQNSRRGISWYELRSHPPTRLSILAPRALLSSSHFTGHPLSASLRHTLISPNTQSTSPLDAMHSADYAVARCPSVCLSHAVLSNILTVG